MIRENLEGSNPSPVVCVRLSGIDMVKFKEIRQGVILITESLADDNSNEYLIIVDNFGTTHIFEAKKIN